MMAKKKEPTSSLSLSLYDHFLKTRSASNQFLFKTKKNKNLLPIRNIINFLKHQAVCFFYVSFHGGKKEGTHFTTLTLPVLSLSQNTKVQAISSYSKQIKNISL